MEKFLFKKIELWVLGLVLVVAIIGMILFGAVIIDEERGGRDLKGGRFGALGEAALAVAELPKNARQALKTVGQPDQTMMNFPNMPADMTLADGWSWAQPPGSGGLDGYLLLSRYDGNLSRHVIDLVSLTTGETLRTWAPEPEALLSNVVRRPEFEDFTDFGLWNNEYFRYIHPYLTETGEMLLKDHDTPLFKLSACGDLMWVLGDSLFHHSTNSDGEGGFWIPNHKLEDRPEDISPKFVLHSIVRVSAEGEVVFEEAMDEAFQKSGLGHLLFQFGGYYDDPMHLNDIEPVMADGPYWQKDDLFLSFRDQSLVALYRPSSGKFVWWKAGPWLAQHDVDILDDHRIAVFSNNTVDKGLGPRTEGISETMIYDFSTDTVESPFHDVLEQLSALTSTEGLQDFTSSGHLIFEETNRGRIFIISGAGELMATFTNRADNGSYYRLGWSRYLSQTHGDNALKAIVDSGCQ